MKALSIKQPWAWLYCAPDLKDVENRTWPTDIRGRVLIHASLSQEDMGGMVLADIEYRMEKSGKILGEIIDFITAFYAGDLDFGAIIGEVEIIDCVAKSNSPWFIGPFGFVRANPVLYKHPIPYKGQLGFFDVDIPESQLEAARGH